MSNISIQLKRLIRLASELKKNNYPTAISFAEKLRNEQKNGDHSLGCSSKTIQRDIEKLKFDFKAPIEYDNARKGYYLKHHGWNMPSIALGEDEMISILLGARVAETIFPNPLKSKIRLGTDILLAENNPDFLDTACMKSIVITSGLKSQINQNCFEVIFECWQKKLAVTIKYMSVERKITTRTIEPHALLFNDGHWLTKAFCHKRKDFRMFALQRVKTANKTNKKFEQNNNMINRLKTDKVFDFKQIKDIQISCDKSIIYSLYENPLHPNQEIIENKNDFSIKIPNLSERDIIKWIFNKKGKAKIITPKSLKDEVLKEAIKIMEAHK